MVAAGLTITRAIQSAPWPSTSANLEYAGLWGTIGPVSDAAVRVADGVVVHRISTLLEAEGAVTGNPVRLRENAGIAFQGCIVLGMGFVLDPAEAQEWVDVDPRNADVLFPYLNGEDLNSRPDCTASRWVIDFNDRTETSSARYALPFARVLARVKPERDRNNRKARREGWWRFAEVASGMRRAIAGLDEVLVLTQVSKVGVPTMVPTNQVFDQRLVVFASSDSRLLAVISSSAHMVWAIKYSATLETRLSYTPSDAFLTFPRPGPTEWLGRIGRVLETERREMMLRRGLGLTSLYNLVNDPEVTADPDVDRLRAIHVELDEAVMAAYGWSDVELDHGFHTYRQMTRWTVCPAARVEILDRLLEENHRRAALQGEVAPAASDDDELEGDE